MSCEFGHDTSFSVARVCSPKGSTFHIRVMFLLCVGVSSFACAVHLSIRCVNRLLDAPQVVCRTGRKSWMFTCVCVWGGGVSCLCLVGFIIAWDRVCLPCAFVCVCRGGSMIVA